MTHETPRRPAAAARLRRRLTAAMLALGVAIPALALAQAEGATGGADRLEGAGDRGGLSDNFRQVPRDSEGRLREYEPPTLPRPEMTDARHARLRLLDKMTGQVETLEMDAGETRVEDRLELALRVCRVPVGDDRGDAVAYLEIRDLREDAPRFAGWMFAASPALSALDHARYDVWVESCSTSSASGSSGNE
ncbi:MAG: DUF2155 domain-containing protein [Pseudomonadota bacterium]|nr:DUF2155 domain-containing protein [Pseudomonadota bacterium]MEE3101925.1 DUF2155 domain-containing protein [Pseudomonadota bacterium]